MDIIKEFKEKIQNKDNKSYTKYVFILGLAGILLIFLSSVITPKNKTIEKSTESSGELDYIASTEKRLTELLCKTQGVGKVSVMITLESETDTIYAQNERTDSEKNNTDQKNISEKSSFENEHIILDDGTGKHALVETRLAPQVKGVAVICEGGADIRVVSEVTQLICALLDVPTNRICVSKMI